MSPAAAKAAMGTMACCLAESVSETACVWGISVDAGVAGAAWQNTDVRPSTAMGSTPTLRRLAAVVLVIIDFLHPFNILAARSPGDGQMGHCGLWRGTMSMLDARRAPHQASRLGSSAPTASATTPGEYGRTRSACRMESHQRGRTDRRGWPLG